MTILIIGSKGFIGKALVRHLKTAQYTVYEADIVHSYGDDHYFQLDASNADTSFNELLSQQKFHVCINCSGAALVGESYKHPMHDYQLNTINVYSMLYALKRFNPGCHFITMSSAAIYGEPGTLPISEEQEVKPISPYGFHKAQAETMCSYFSEIYGLNTSALRIFSAYGPGLKKQLFWDLYQKVQKSPSYVELFGSGSETRDFIFIDDICEIISLLITQETSGFQVYNVGAGKQEYIRDVASIFFELLGFKGAIKFTNNKLEGYPSQWEADISKIQSLGFSRLTELKVGLSKYVQWLRDIERG